MSRGTVATASALLDPDVLVRKEGRLATVPGGRRVEAFDFGEGLEEATPFSWADVMTAEFTTGVGDIEVYSQSPWPQRVSYRGACEAMARTGAGPWRAMTKAWSAAWPQSPSPQVRDRAGFVMVAEALDAWRRSTRLRMRTLDGYTVSAITGRAIVERVLAGAWRPGFQTPGRLLGGAFILGLGCATLDAAA
jgi:short subunit dehydrogenase-like uncharacterized protein